jgi:hypothetical protein
MPITEIHSEMGVQGAKPLPEREVSSLTLSSPGGPQARQRNDEWMSDACKRTYATELRKKRKKKAAKLVLLCNKACFTT